MAESSPFPSVSTHPKANFSFLVQFILWPAFKSNYYKILLCGKELKVLSVHRRATLLILDM